MGSAGALLALGSLAMPLALAMVLHMLSPRGSRESLANRLGHVGQGSLVILLVIMTLLGAFLIGLVGRTVVLLAGGPGVGHGWLTGNGAAWARAGLLLASRQVFWPAWAWAWRFRPRGQCCWVGKPPWSTPDLESAQGSSGRTA